MEKNKNQVEQLYNELTKQTKYLKLINAISLATKSKNLIEKTRYFYKWHNTKPEKIKPVEPKDEKPEKQYKKSDDEDSGSDSDNTR